MNITRGKKPGAKKLSFMERRELEKALLHQNSPILYLLTPKIAQGI